MRHGQDVAFGPEDDHRAARGQVLEAQLAAGRAAVHAGARRSPDLHADRLLAAHLLEELVERETEGQLVDARPAVVTGNAKQLGARVLLGANLREPTRGAPRMYRRAGGSLPNRPIGIFSSNSPSLAMTELKSDQDPG